MVEKQTSQTNTSRKGCLGTTLVELLIALVINVIVIGGTFQVFNYCNYLSQTARESSVATSDLRDIMERIAATPFVSLTATFPNGTANGGGTTDYAAIVGGYNLDSESITVTYIDPTADPLEIIVTLNWTDVKGRARSMSMSTKRTE